MLIPNTGRVIVRPLEQQPESNGLIIPGQMKAGENLFIGKIVHPGTTKFTKDQVVYYSEYSAARVLDLGPYFRGESSLGDTMKAENIFVVVAEDDLMAYEEIADDVRPIKNSA